MSKHTPKGDHTITWREGNSSIDYLLATPLRKAAPDLLAVAEVFDGFLEVMSSDNQSPKSAIPTASVLKVHEMVKAAIKKATDNE